MTSKILLRNDHANVACLRAQPVYARQTSLAILVCVDARTDRSVFRRPLPLIMSHNRAQKDKGQKANANQTILTDLLKEEENRYCSDCGAKGMECFSIACLPPQILLCCLQSLLPGG